jgi:hypothetical protein
MSFGNTFENNILDGLFGSTQIQAVTTMWIGLSTADPGEDASGLAEPSGNGYARVAMTNSTNNWSAAAAGVKRNSSVQSFPTATGSWGSVTHWTLWAAATSTGVGAYIGVGSLGIAKNITNGDTPLFGVGSISITLD